jgi:hypothetical protein
MQRLMEFNYKKLKVAQGSSWLKAPSKNASDWSLSSNQS